MKIEQQVTSLKISKHLKELGVKQDSLFRYSIYSSGKVTLKYSRNVCGGIDEEIAAFTVAELWNYLPQFLPNHTELEDGIDRELYMGKNDPKNGGSDYTFVSYSWKANFNDDEPAKCHWKAPDLP